MSTKRELLRHLFHEDVIDPSDLIEQEGRIYFVFRFSSSFGSRREALLAIWSRDRKRFEYVYTNGERRVPLWKGEFHRMIDKFQGRS